jgi:hypothetical protein
MRCFANHVKGDRLADNSCVSFPDQSVNRQAFSRPFDVLLPEPGTSYAASIFKGVLRFKASSIPLRLQRQDQSEICTLEVAHDPVAHNYSHTEIRAMVNGDRVTREQKKVVSKADRKPYRLLIMDLARIIIPPIESTRDAVER